MKTHLFPTTFVRNYFPHHPIGRITLLTQSSEMRLQYKIIVLLGLHTRLTLLELAQYLYAGRPVEELPLATVELAVWDLRKTGMVRRHWLSHPRRFCLARHGRQLHQELVEESYQQPASTRGWSDGLLP